MKIITAREVIQLRRVREGKTNYRKRIEMLKSGKPRLVVRKTIKHITAQIVEFTPKGDKVLVSANTKELVKYGWKAGTGNIPSAYLCGVLIAKKAKEKNIDDVILDTGLQTSVKGNRIYATAKGAKDAGLKLPFDDKMAPSK